MARVELYTKPLCPFCDRAKHLLREKGQEYSETDVEAQPEKRDEMIRRAGRTTLPQIFIDGVHVGGFDELAELERRGQLDGMLGLRGAARSAEAERAQLLILGSGPAGYTAAVYAARAELEPVVLAGLQFGGQLMLTTDVENYPGFPEGVTGPEMMERFQKQAERFGARIIFEDAVKAELSGPPFRIATDSREFLAGSVIVATGASARWLGLPSEQRLMNKGVSACATCDGALYRDKPMAVVGGGDTALEEALFLTRYAPKVTLIHRRNELRASKIMQERARASEKIEFLWDSEVEEVLGEEFVRGVRVKNRNTGESHELAVEALFIAIGHKPNTDLFRGQLDLDSVGYIQAVPGGTRTNIEGVFACGDAMDPTYRQAVTAAGTGCMAAIDCERWLAAQSAR